MKALKYGALMLLLLLPALLAAKTLDTLTWSMKHRDAASVLPRLAEDLGSSGSLKVDFERNTLTITDSSANIKRLKQLLARLDVAPRRFAVKTRLEVLDSRRGHGILKPGAGFFDVTQWLMNSRPIEVYSSVMNMHEGEKTTASLGRDFELQLAAQGYDPTTRRLAFSRVALLSSREKESSPLFEGSAALPEGKPTVLLATSSELAEGYRLQLRPVLLPVVKTPEVP